MASICTNFGTNKQEHNHWILTERQAAAPNKARHRALFMRLQSPLVDSVGLLSKVSFSSPALCLLSRHAPRWFSSISLRFWQGRDQFREFVSDCSFENAESSLLMAEDRPQKSMQVRRASIMSRHNGLSPRSGRTIQPYEPWQQAPWRE